MGEKRILVIAGSDSSGGAGLEADQKVIAAHGCYAMTSTTALTAQNTEGVQDIHHSPPEFVGKQIRACIDDIGVDVVKTGMLASAETIKVVAQILAEVKCPTIVDPVMASTTGSELLPTDAIQTFKEKLLPLTAVLTPNIPEANLLAGRSKDSVPSSQEDMLALARDLHALGPKYILLKGGHLGGETNRSIVDLLFDGQNVVLIEKPFLKSRNTHGTGCSLASAVACNLALGYDVPSAVRKACEYVEAGIKLSIDRGKGSGPINHFHSTYMLPFAPGRFVDYVLARPDVQDAWRGYTEHEFVQKLAHGTLEMDKFKGYLVQDYLFLTEFARAKGLSASKIKSIDAIVAEADIMLHIHREMDLHLTYCASFGLTREQIQSSQPAPACMAYTSYLHDVGHSEDWFALQMAMAPCLLGYGAIARRLYDAPDTVRGDQNTYYQWILNYIAEDYTDAVDKGRGLLSPNRATCEVQSLTDAAILEEHAVNQSPKRIEELVKIFLGGVRLETGFWDMGHAGNY